MPVKEPTKWINSMVAVRKPGKLRLCIDPKDLNGAIKRPYYPLPTIEDILRKITNAKIFLVLILSFNDILDTFW